MSSKTKKFTLVLLTLASLNLALVPMVTSAQDQTADLQIEKFRNFGRIPDTLMLPETFVSETTDVDIYKPFSPSNINEILEVVELANDGGFRVDLSVSPFTAGSNTIPYSDVGIVTLASASAPHSVDTPSTNSFNNPPGDDNLTVFAPLDCDWDEVSSFADTCNAATHSFYPPGFVNFTGSGIESDPITIMDTLPPTNGTGRIGIYSLTLGIKMTIPAGTVADDYSSNFLFTIYPIYPTV